MSASSGVHGSHGISFWLPKRQNELSAQSSLTLCKLCAVEVQPEETRPGGTS